jgi:hypothetical protein
MALEEQARSEAAGRIAAEEMLRQLQDAHAMAARQALLRQQELERKLALEHEERQRVESELEYQRNLELIRIEKEIAAHNMLLNMKAILIQSFWRKTLIRRKYVCVISSATKIQAWYRMTVCYSKYQLDLQDMYAMRKQIEIFTEKRQLRIRDTAAHNITTCIREFANWKKCQRLNSATKTIQMWILSLILHNRFISMRTNAKKIQNAWKNRMSIRKTLLLVHQIRVTKLQRRICAEKIQRQFRKISQRKALCTVIKKRQESRVLAIEKAQKTINRFCFLQFTRKRQNIAASRIQKWFSCFTPLMYARRFYFGIRRLQVCSILYSTCTFNINK